MIYKDPYQTTKDILDLINVNFIIHPHDFGELRHLREWECNVRIALLLNLDFWRNKL